MVNMKDAQIDAYKKYARAVGKAKPNDVFIAMSDSRSVADDELNAYVALHYGMYYNVGLPVDDKSLTDVARQKYAKWVKDWGFELPDGKPPLKSFNIGDYL